METTQLQLAVVTPLDNLRNRTIESNVKELLPIVQAKAREYRDTQYGITQEKICKEDRARLNKFQIAINDELKEIREANNEPYERFACEVQPVIDAVAEAMKSLDNQLAEMENLWRTNNMENAKLLYDSIIGSSKFAFWAPWEKILITKKTGRTSYEDFFGNKTSWNYAEGHEDTKDLDILKKAGKKVVEVFEQLLKSAQDKLSAINELDYPEEIKMQGIGYISTSYDPIKRGFDIEGAFKLMGDLARREREKAEAVERAKREAEEKARREAEEAKRRAEAEKQRAIEEERRKAEAEKQKAIEEAQRKAREEERKRAIEEEARRKAEEQKAKEQKQAEVAKPSGKTIAVRFEAIFPNVAAVKGFKEYCSENGIELKQI